MGNNKKKIIAIHGWAYSTDKWDSFVDMLEDKNYSTRLLKVPGLIEKTDKVWDVSSYVEWLRKSLAREKGKVILLGHSNGGRIAIAYASKYPERLKQLILIDSAGIFHNELPIRIKRFVFKSVAKIGRVLTPSQKLRELLHKLAREKDYREATPQMRKTMVNLISTDLTSELPKIKTPTLIVWGEDDSATPPKDGKLMHQLIKNSKLEIIKSARHSPHFTHSREVVDKIIQFLK